jgi:hypothetical protein
LGGLEVSEQTLTAPSEFLYSTDKLQVHCKLCKSRWLAARNAKQHLTSVEHLKALQVAEDARHAYEVLENERRAEASTSELRNIHITTRHLDGPSRASGGLEAEMWRDYEYNGAEFTAGDDTGDERVRHQHLHAEAESFGLLDPEAAARKLGFGGVDLADEMLAEDEDEDFLSEIMRNAGECRLQAGSRFVCVT